MKCISFLVIASILCVQTVHAQYQGGVNDGISSSTVLNNNPLSGIYTGGINDGHANSLTLNQNPLSGIYLGGNNDGVALASVTNQNPLASIYLGGSNDGFATLQVTGQNASSNIYTGGNNDGFANQQVLNQNPLSSIYLGGNNDGFTNLQVLNQNPLTNIYTGDKNDGFAAATAIGIQNPSDQSFITLLARLRIYLEGALANNASAVAPDGRPLMRDNLRNSPFTGANYIPVQDPYEFATAHVNVTAKYTKLAPQDVSHPQFQQVTDSATVFGVTGQNAIVDWVFVELRSKANSATVVATRAALLQRDGDIVDVDGVSSLSFPGVALDSYYVAVRHRNHLGAMSGFAQSVANIQSLVDLTLSATPMFDFGVSLGNGVDYTGLATNNNVKPGYRALWAGDFNADKKVKYDNPQGDDNVIFFDVITDPSNSGGVTNYDLSFGYWQGDYNLDSKDKYDNPNSDHNMLMFQVISYPRNTTNWTNYNFLIQQLP